MVAIAALAVAGIAFYLTSEALLERINRTDITTEDGWRCTATSTGRSATIPVLGFGYGTFADSFRLYDHAREWCSLRSRAQHLAGKRVRTGRAGRTGAVTWPWRGWPGPAGGACRRRHRDWVYPATGVAASVLVGLHAMLDFSLQLPAVAILYACIMGIACAQSFSSIKHG